MTHPTVENLIELCRSLGRRVPDWSQGTGGNISLKLAENGKRVLWIKASGLRLATIKTPSSLARVDLAEFSAKWEALASEYEPESAYADLLRACASHQFGRPSMETGFHALLPRRWVVHVHSLQAILMAHRFCREPGRVVSWLERQSFRPLFLPPLRPGLNLSRLIGERGGGHDFIVLQNHGLIVHSDNLSILERWHEVEAAFAREFGYNKVITTKGAPLRFYFPDAAVFADRLRMRLRPVGVTTDGEKLFVMEPGQDTDAYEIWQAIETLYQREPMLEALPSSISETVSSLPTEIYRKGIKR